MIEIARRLHSRGMHRMFGNPSLGTISAFLTFIFILRALVNLYFVYDISNGNARMELNQIAGNWFLYLSAYFISCSSLSSLHISFALPHYCFIGQSPGGSRFRSQFMRLAALTRPINIAVIITAVIGSFIFIKAGTGVMVIAGGFIIIFYSIILGYILFKIADRFSPGMPEIQILETAALSALVILNPDVIQFRGSVSILFNGIYFPFNTFTAILAPAAILSVFTGFVFIEKILAISFEKGKLFKLPGVISNWYIRYFQLKYWLILYLIIIPIVYLPVFPLKIKLTSILFFTILNVVSFLLFISNCKNMIEEKWRIELFKRRNSKFFFQSAVIHIILMILPLTGFLFYL